MPKNSSSAEKRHSESNCVDTMRRFALRLARSASPSRTAVRLYHPNVVDHYENPRNVGSLDSKSKKVGTGERFYRNCTPFRAFISLCSTGLVGAPACGDVMKLQIEIDEKGNIEQAKFKTFGCGSAIASRCWVGVMVSTCTRKGRAWSYIRARMRVDQCRSPP
eukprot:1370240-Amorphochlora_amoeboformis.AAC.2